MFGVALPARPAVQLEALAQQHLGAVEVAVQPQHRGERTHADGSLPVFIAKHAAPDRQRLALQRFGAVVQPSILVHAPELDHRDGDVQRAPNPADGGASRAPVPGLRGLGVVALLGQHRTEVVEGLGDPQVLGARTPAPRSPAPARAAPAPCRRRRTDGRCRPSTRQDLGARLGLIRQRLLHLLGRRRRAVRARSAPLAWRGSGLDRRSSATRSAPRSPWPPSRPRAGRGRARPPAASCRTPSCRPAGRPPPPTRQGRGHGARRTSPSDIAGVRPRANRLAAQVPPQITGQRRHRAVALLGLLLQGLGDDGVEVPA